MNIREIARIASVSPATVSKILNNKDKGISEATRNRVLKVIEENNYVPRLSVTTAGKIATNRLIGFMGWENNFRLGFLESALSDKGYALVLCGSKSSLNSHVFSGLIVSDREALKEKIFTDSVVVSCFEPDTRSKKITVIKRDYRMLGKDTAKLCKKMGFLHLGVFFGEKPVVDRDNFLKGLDDSCKDFLVSKPNISVTYNEDFNYLFQAGAEVFICEDQQAAQKIYAFATSFKLEIGRDIQVLCLSKDDLRIFSPTLAYVLVDEKIYWSNVAKFIIDKIEGYNISKENINFEKQRTVILEGESLKKSQPKNKVVVVGSTNLDTIMKMRNIGAADETTLIDSVNTFHGGKGANQAAGLAKLGCSPYLISNIGRDQAGFEIINALKNIGVNIEAVSVDKENGTGQAYITVSEKGESAIYVYRGASEHLSKSQIDQNEDMFEKSEYCLISTEINMDTIRYAIKTAKKHNLKIVIKPSAISAIKKDLVDGIYLFVPNNKEAETLLPGLSLEEKCDKLLKLGAQNVIITLGERGLYFKNNNISKYYKAAGFKAEDTTGGADAFISALVALLCAKEDLDNAIEYASYAAGYCVSQKGVQNALISKELLDEHIRLKKQSP